MSSIRAGPGSIVCGKSSSRGGVFFAFSPQHAAVAAKIHPITTSSCLASGGRARRDSSRLCLRIRVIASRRFARHSSRDLPCPLAPGTSAQYATYHGPSCSTIAVNSLCTCPFYRCRHTLSCERRCVLRRVASCLLLDSVLSPPSRHTLSRKVGQRTGSRMGLISMAKTWLRRQLSSPVAFIHRSGKERLHAQLAPSAGYASVI
jgi:hypothetical protein